MEKVRIFFAAGLLTAAAVSEAAVATLPYRQQFSDEASLADFTVIDGDGNGRTWKTDMGAACNPGNQDNTDDWLITPGFLMEKGKMYNVRFSAWGSSYYEMFEVKVGTDPSAAGMTESFVETRQVQANSFSPLSVEEVFVPQADGVYYFGFHSVTADRNFYIDNLEIDAPVTLNAPEAVTDLAVLPDQNGLNRAEITFTVPSKTVEGNDLTEISGVRVQRGDEVIANKTDVLPGQKVTVEDAVPAAGYYTY
ncbi:MAG: choice-of-anchor J domain-containing protein, partial [Duncaniella sp.]|nr:choice-of-anchor J domain-containing protein [Duncaniella sp.]